MWQTSQYPNRGNGYNKEKGYTLMIRPMLLLSFIKENQLPKRINMSQERKRTQLGLTKKRIREGQKPGFQHLEIFLTNDEEHPFYEVAEVNLPIASPAIRGGNKQYDLLTVSAAWKQEATYQVLPGDVMLTLDCAPRQNVEFYTFGGSIHISGDQTITRCQLTSPAPIFHRSNEETPQELLVEEIDILLAQQHARWGDNDAGYWQTMMDLEPVALYRSCLDALHEKFSHDRYQKVLEAGDLRALVDAEIHAWSGDEVPALSSLLAPPLSPDQ